jgi:hypothetical protein
MTWMAAVVVASVFVAILRGGKLDNIMELHLTGWWMLPLAFAMQIGAAMAPNDGTREDFELLGLNVAVPLPVILVLASFVPLLAVVWLNKNQAGMWIAGIGILMNFTVIALNSGMPVLAEAVELSGGTFDPATLDAKHVVLNGSTDLAFLADVIPFPGSVISLGDVFLAIGLGVFIEDQLTRPLRLFRHGAPGVPGSAAER